MRLRLITSFDLTTDSKNLAVRLTRLKQLIENYINAASSDIGSKEYPFIFNADKNTLVRLPKTSEHSIETIYTIVLRRDAAFAPTCDYSLDRSLSPNGEPQQNKCQPNRAQSRASRDFYIWLHDLSEDINTFLHPLGRNFRDLSLVKEFHDGLQKACD